MNGNEMTAWVKKSDMPGLVKEMRPVPKIKEDEVLVKVLATGICGTDFGIYKGYRQVPENLIPGHEFIGEIVEVGDKVFNYKPGDYVIPSIIQKCGRCFACLSGYESQCENLLEIGIHINGSFAEYVAVPEVTLHKAPKGMELLDGASVEPVAVAFSAVKKVEGFIAGKDVLIYGPGAIGLYTAQIAKLAGAGTVVLAGIGEDEKRLALAKEHYGIETVNQSEEDMDQCLNSHFRGGKADIVFDATGVAGLIKEMIPRLAPHGQLILLGIYKDLSSMDLLQVVRGELSIRGSFCYTLSEFEYAIKLVREGRICFDGIVETMKLSDLDKGFEKALSKEAIKVVVTP